MSCEIFKVSTETLEKLRELSSEKDSTIRDIVEIAITDYYDKNCVAAIKFILTDDEEFMVKPKKAHQQVLEDITGKKGPYKVTKTCKSKLGHSEGVYKLEDCDAFLPIAYFDKVNKQFNKLTWAVMIGWFIALLQSGVLLYLLPLI